MIWQYRLAHCCSRRGIVMGTSGLPDMLACGVNSWRFSAEGVGALARGVQKPSSGFQCIQRGCPVGLGVPGDGEEQFSMSANVLTPLSPPVFINQLSVRSGLLRVCHL
jgi:hypothetical protein